MLNRRHTRSRTIGFALLAALGLAAALAILPGCESTPAEPVYDNPFDPDGRSDLPARAEMLHPEDVAEAVLFAVTRPAHVRIPLLQIEPG